MDVWKILKNNARELIPEDLDFFETELATGGPYEEKYVEKCLAKIELIRKWMDGVIDSPDENSNSKKETESTENTEKKKKSSSKGSLVMHPEDVMPEEMKDDTFVGMTPLERFQWELDRIRERNDYKAAFKRYLKSSNIIDEAFIDKNIGLFDSWEVDAIVMVMPLSEAFLEKYFGIIDHVKIAKYQLFSEAFYMKHFAQLDTLTVLERGKNEWRKKENRSKQLDVFLRLKGVKI